MKKKVVVGAALMIDAFGFFRWWIFDEYESACSLFKVTFARCCN